MMIRMNGIEWMERIVGCKGRWDGIGSIDMLQLTRILGMFPLFCAALPRSQRSSSTLHIVLQTLITIQGIDALLKLHHDGHYNILIVIC